jgi:hypothetical protein
MDWRITTRLQVAWCIRSLKRKLIDFVTELIDVFGTMYYPKVVEELDKSWGYNCRNGGDKS